MYHNICTIEEIIDEKDKDIVHIDKTEELTNDIPFLKESVNEDWRLAWAELFNKLDLVLISCRTVTWNIKSVELDQNKAYISFTKDDRQFYLTFSIVESTERSIL